MENIILDLFYGNIEPQELTTEITPRLRKLLNKLTTTEESFKSTLDEDSRNEFEKYVNEYNELSAVSCSDAFVSGFRLGAKFAYDTFVVK